MNNLQDYIGVYRQDKQNSFVFSMMNDRLTLSIDKDKSIVLSEGAGPGQFFSNDPSIKVEFGPLDKKFVSAVHLHFDDRSIIANRVFDQTKPFTLTHYFKELSIFFGIIVLCLMAATYFFSKGSERGAIKIKNFLSYFSTDKSKEQSKACSSGDYNNCRILLTKYPEMGMVDKARELYIQFCQDKNEMACEDYSKFLYQNREYIENRKVLSQMCELKMSYGCLEMANFHLKNESYDLAIKNYTDACLYNEIEGCYQAAQVYLKKDYFKESLKYFQNACESKHKNSCKKVQLISTLIPALEDCNKSNDTSCKSVGKIFVELLDHQKAKHYFNIACKLNPSNC
jgi:hypothetical protein